MTIQPIVASKRAQLVRGPLVSVVMPVYNHAAFVGDAIKSVFAQTYRPIELIIIDDGSKDSSADVIDTLLARQPAPEGIWVQFLARENRGAAATINEGLKLATGTYLSILNSDDAYLPERLERCVRTIERHDARLVFSYVEPIAADGEPLDLNHPWLAWYHETIVRELDRSPSLSFLLLTHNIAVSSGNFLFHRKLITEIGTFENYRYTHDLDFLLRASLIEEPVLVREKLYRYRLHGHNTIVALDTVDDSEKAAVIRNYFVAAAAHQAKNPLAPSFGNWPNSLGILNSQDARVLLRMFDELVETPTPVFSEEGQGEFTMPKCIPGNRITIISHDLSRSGAPAIVMGISEISRSAGADVNVVAMKDGPLRQDFKRIRIPVTILEFREGWDGLKKLSNVMACRDLATLRTIFASGIRRILGAFLQVFRLFVTPAAVIRMIKQVAKLTVFSLRRDHGTLLVNSFASFPLAFLIIQRWRGPIFWYIHETYDPQIFLRGRDPRRYLEDLQRSKNIQFLFGSDATRQVFAREGFDGRVLYWSGLPSNYPGCCKKAEDNQGRSASKERRTILSVGTSGPRKGTRALIEAFALGIKEQLIPADVELVIVAVVPPSRDPQSRDFILRIMQPDLMGRVRLIGAVEPRALVSYYRQAEIYVQSSTMECLPLAILTAMAHALPIVTTDVDGCTEAIIDEVCGLTVPPRQIDRMAAAMAELLQSPSKARRLGDAARKRFEEKFSLEVTAHILTKTIFPSSEHRQIQAEEQELNIAVGQQ